MNYGAVKTILEKAISSPAQVEVTELDEAIRWVEDRGTIRRLDRGADRDATATNQRSVRRRHSVCPTCANAVRFVREYHCGPEVSGCDLLGT